jgi:molybdopterin converting factor small subunit
MADVGEGTRAADVFASAVAQFPTLKSAAASVAFAVNRTQVPPETVLHEGDELALLPPMAGG